MSTSNRVIVFASDAEQALQLLKGIGNGTGDLVVAVGPGRVDVYDRSIVITLESGPVPEVMEDLDI